MNARLLPTLLLVTTLPLGCSKDESSADGKAEAKADAKSDGKADGDAKAGDAKADGGETKAGDAKAGDTKTAAANAAGGEVANPDAVTDCPESLSGKDNVDRVITKECGVVPVTGNYSVEGATLTLMPGATLAFAEGAKLTVGYYETAKLIVNGTAKDPVTFTTSGDKAAGVWEGVQLYGKANRSALNGLVIEYAGKKKAALHVEAEDVTIAGCTVREAKEHAIEVRGEGTATIAQTTFENIGPVAVRTTPAAAGGVAGDNTYPAGAVVQIEAGRLQDDATWAALGTPWLLTGRVQVHGEAGHRATLTVAEGAELHFDGDGTLDVGYYAEGGLKAEGSAAKPILFGAHERKEPGGWNGLRIYAKAEASIKHANFSHGGKKDNEGVLHLAGEARLVLEDTTFANNATGVAISGNKADIQSFDRVKFQGTAVALRGSARYLGELGAANTYEGEPRIVAEADKVEEDATWALQSGAKVELDGRLQISGARVTMAAGTTLHVKDGVEIQVGYYDTAGLLLEGTADQPITFQGQRDEPGTWGGVVFFGKAKGNVLENVVIRNAGGQAGVRFDGESDAKITGLRCDNCSTPALKWGCKGTVEHSAVEAGEGTPSALEAPKCK